MYRRIEGLIQRIEDFEPGRTQSFQHLLLDQLDALVQRHRIGRGRVDMGKA